MPPAITNKINLSAKPKNTKIIFNDDEEISEVPKAFNQNGQALKKKKSAGEKEHNRSEKVFVDLSVKSNKKNKKIIFNDDEEISEVPDAVNENDQAKKKKTKSGAEKDQNRSEKVVDIPVESKKKNKKIIFNDDDEILEVPNEVNQNGQAKKKIKSAGEKEQNRSEKVVDISVKSNKKIVFDDEGEIVTDVGAKKKTKNKSSNAGQIKSDNEEEEDYFAKRDKKLLKQQQLQESHEDDTAQKKWFDVYRQFESNEEVLDMKDTEQIEFYNICKSAFEAEKANFNKRNPSDSRWLQTALHKGTAKDRANAGALLVTSNPLGNLEALSTLIGYTKISNKSSADVIAIVTDLWKEVLLPNFRKLVALQMRGADWKKVRKDTTMAKERQRRIYAYWYFENELKEQYFEFLKNLQQGIQTGQENNKNSAIVAASQLLVFAPEKEQMLLTMVINKLGDPIAKIASKALHHLTEVAHKHPNMCGVIVAETEKLLFRNNISDRAQHFALCFLSSVAPAGKPEVCTKLVHICFSLFKVLVQKGAVNNRTMQAILRCLQKAILEAKPTEGNTEVLNKEMQDTVYRLVHLADLQIAVQTLGLLLQLITVKTEKSDRFYNALYKKLLDLDVSNIGTKTAAQLLHIIHRAIHIDANVARAQAFVKRLLQVSLYMPPNMAAGCLIVLHKLLRNRKELAGAISTTKAGDGSDTVALPKVSADDEELARFDSDGEEKYEDVHVDGNIVDEKIETKANTVPSSSSWHHTNISTTTKEEKVREIAASKYDPFHRVPTFAGAEFALRTELLLLREHFHPTVQVFADSILNQQRIDYYGDPLRDFGLPHFLERFAFKNPKKLDNEKAAKQTVAHRRYTAFGARGKPVKSLTKANCTEDEMFIFNFLELKRERAAIYKTKKTSNELEADEDLKKGEINDDEFESYLDGYFGKKAKAAALAEEEDEDELDFLKELGGEMNVQTKEKQKKTKAVRNDDENLEDIDADWGDDDEDGHGAVADDDSNDSADEDDGSADDDDGGSISLEENADSDENEESIDASESDDDDKDEDEDDDDDDDAPKSKKSRKESSAYDSKSFAKKLKHSDDMSSLFAAADDFAELLEDTGKTKGQGTVNAVFNKDKSSDKQMKWEEKRHSNKKINYTKKSNKFAKKRKH